MCGSRNPAGPTERTSAATAPCAAARDGPLPELHRLGVLGKRHVVENNPSFDAIAVCVELFEAAHDEHFRFDPVGRRSDTVTKAQHYERSLPRRSDFRALPSAHPVRHRDWFGVDILEAVLLHLRDRPLNGVFQSFGPAEAVAECIAHQRQPVPRERARQCVADNPGRDIAIGVDPRAIVGTRLAGSRERSREER